MSHVPTWKLPTPPSASTSSKIKVATVGLQDLGRFGVESAATDNFATPKDVRRHPPPGGSTLLTPAESSESEGSPTPVAPESSNRSPTDPETPARFLWSGLKRSPLAAGGVTKEAALDAEGNKRKRASPPAWENHMEIDHADISTAQHGHNTSSRSEVAGGSSASQTHAVCADGPMNGYDSESEDESILGHHQQLLRGDDGRLYVARQDANGNTTYEIYPEEWNQNAESTQEHMHDMDLSEETYCELRRGETSRIHGSDLAGSGQSTPSAEPEPLVNKNVPIPSTESPFKMTDAPRIREASRLRVPETPVSNHRLQQQPQQHHSGLNDECTPTEPVEQEHPDKLTADEIRERLDALNSQLSHKLGELTTMLGKHEKFRSQIWKEIDAHKEYLLTQGTKLEDRKAKLQQHFEGFGKAVGVKFEDRFA